MNTLNNENPINNENSVNRSNEVPNLSNSNIPYLNDLSEKYQTGIMGTIMSLYIQLLNIFAKYGINKTMEFFNLDPNSDTKESLQELTSNITQFKEILKSPEGKELLNELSDLLLVATKELEKPIDELTNIMNELIDKEITVGQQLLFNEIKIALGPVGATIEIVNDAINATANVADATAEATGIFKEEVDKFNEIKAKIQLWLEKLKTASKSREESQNSPGSTLVPGPQQTPSPTPMTGGKKIHQTFNHIQKGGKQSAKRTKKSISDFLNSGIKSSQIIKMINGKGKTRRKRHTKRSHK